MAVLKHCETGEWVALREYHVFGRNASIADTLLSPSEVSKLHASVQWDGQCWLLQDHSKNGTWLDQQRVRHGERVALRAQAYLSLAGQGVARWRIESLAPPSPLLVPLSIGHPVIVLDVADDQSNTFVFWDQGRHGWVHETDNQLRLLDDGDIVQVNDVAWRLFCPGEVKCQETTEISTDRLICDENAVFEFQASQNEEHVFACVRTPATQTDLGERVHHYLLLLLARQRLVDAARGVEKDSQGWMPLDELSAKVGLDSAYVNLQVYRARKQLAHVLPEYAYAAQLVERRAGEIRFGCAAFRILKGDVLEGELLH